MSNNGWKDRLAGRWSERRSVRRRDREQYGGRRLRLLLTWAFVLVVAVPVIALALIPPLVDARRERVQVTEDLEQVADSQEAALLNWTEGRQTDLLGIANNSFVQSIARGLLTESATSDSGFQSYVSVLNHPFDHVLLLDLDGVVRAADQERLVGFDASTESWFRSATAADEGTVVTVGPLHDPVDDQPSLYFSTPYYHAGQMVGVLAARTSTEPLAEILSRTPLAGETTDIYLLRAGRQYVVEPRLGGAGLLAEDEVAREVLRGLSGSATWTDYRGERVIGAYRWIAPLNVALVTKQDLSETLDDSRALLRLQLLVGLAVAGLAAAAATLISRRIAGTLSQTGAVASTIAAGDLRAQVPASGLLEVNQVASAINDLTARLREMIGEQEAIIESRTRELAITARMGQAIASETDLPRLLQSTIDMIHDELGYYHAQVFLLDDLGQNAVLRASMGEAGEEMLARAHRLAVGSNSVVGQAAHTREPVLASDTAHAEFWRPNPLLPDTQAELAIPLTLGAQVLGVLDIQSTDRHVFDEATISVLQTVADQLAVAINNARLLEEQEGLLAASWELTQMLTQESWEEFASRRDEASLGFRYDLNTVQPLDEPGLDDGNGHLKLPIALRGAVIGEVTAQLGEGRALSQDEQQLVSQMLDRVALAMDNARLIEQTQLSLHETNRLYQATQSIAAANTVEELAAELVEVSMLDSVDRAGLFLIDSSSAGASPWVEVAGLRLRDPDDPLHELPRRLRVDTHPLLMNVENIPVGEFVLNDVENVALDPEMADALQAYGVRAVATFAITPAITGQDTLGWLVLHSTRDAQAFMDEDVRYLETVVDQAATALEGLRLFEQTQARARRLQATNEVSRTASSILSPDILLPLIVDRIAEAFGYYHVQIFLVDEAQEWAVLRASTGDVGQELLRRQHRLAVGSRSVIGQTTSTGEPVIIGDIEQDPVHRRNELLPLTRSEMALPLVAGDRVIGALDMQSTEAETFDAEAQAILQSLTDQIAVTLENATLFQEVQERVAELSTVNQVSQAVSRTQTLDELYDVVTQEMMTSLGTEYGFLAVLGEHEHLQLPILIEGGQRQTSPPPFPLGEGLSSHVIRTGEVLLITENAREYARQLGAQFIGTPPRSVLIVPLLLGEEVIGVISLQDAQREHAYDETHVRQLTTLATYIAVKIRNAELLEQAQQRAGELGFLFEITRTAVSGLDLRESLTDVAEIMLREVRGAESVTFFLSEGDGSYEAQAAVGYGREAVAQRRRVTAGEGLVGAAVLAGQSLLLADARKVSQRGTGGLGRTRAAAAVPLKSGREVIGVLTVESSQPGVIMQSDLQLLEGASGTLTAVIQSARLLEEISRTNEQLRELDVLKSQFLANMSHELRTPLNSIIGFSRVILKGIDGPLTDLQEQDLTTIYNSGQHLLGLINNILDLSKIEAGKMEIQQEYMDVDETIDTVISTGRGLVKDKPVEILRDVEEGLPNVYGDVMRVRQVLLNLMSNAAKFTSEGSITLQVRRRPYNPETGEPPRAVFSVRDTGIGIAPEDMNKLFQAFSQVDGSTTRQVGGTGLGLTISKQFVELMGGRIWVESERGVGSTFSFTVPLYPPGSPESEIILASEFEDDRPLVLAVDDEPGVLDLYARYLEKEGYGIIGLNNASDLLEHVREVRPAVIVIDIHLPGKSGWDAIAELKRAEDTADIPIVVSSIEEKGADRLAAGVAEYLVKPVIEDDLLAALQRAVSGRGVKPQDVLIIDADQTFAVATADRLVEMFGCNTRLQATGLAGLEALNEKHPDLLIMDVNLPDMDGFGLLASLRTQEGYTRLPVVVLTARELAEAELARLGGEVTRYIKKNGGDDWQILESLPAILSEVGG